MNLLALVADSRRPSRSVPRKRGSTNEDVAVKFFELFTMISEAINNHGLWDESDGFYRDRPFVFSADGGTGRRCGLRTGRIHHVAAAATPTGAARCGSR
jgi:hypothetical protein